jgi:hypothetical protein
VIITSLAVQLGAQDTIAPPATGSVADSEDSSADVVVVPGTRSGIGRAANDEQAAGIARALDAEVSLEIDQQQIRTAMSALAEAAGVPIEIDPATYGLLPYGSKTIVSATIRERTLRESLSALLMPLGLAFEPQPARILIEPSPPLRRIVRRATWEELEFLEELRTQPYTAERLRALTFQFREINGPDPSAHRQAMLDSAAAVGHGTLAEVLEHACRQNGWSWFPSGRQIVVLDQAAQYERQLEAMVSLNYLQVGLIEALMDLTARAGVPMRLERGVLASLPPQMAEQFSLSIENATVRTALELVAGHTGLGYYVDDQGVHFTSGATVPALSGTQAPDAASFKAAAEALRSDPIVGFVTEELGDKSTYSFFIRESDLPPEVNELRKARIRQQYINQIRRALYADQPQD